MKRTLDDHRRSIVSKAVCLTLVGALMPITVVNAQELENTDSVDPNVEVISIKGVRGSLNRAIGLKRSATGVVDGIVAEDIADFPDLNIGEALQRITGVTLERSENGEGSRINVRGLPSNFVATTLNGITAASAGSNGNDAVRSFDFDTFASELFSNVQIRKSGTADIIEGGIAATVNLETPRPFDYSEPTALISASGQYAELAGGSNSIDPRVAFLASDTWGDFGATVSVAYSDTTTRGDLSQGFRYQTSGAAYLNNTLSGIADGDIDINNINLNGNPTTIGELQDVASNTLTESLPRVGPLIFDRERLGVTSSFQYQASDDLLLTADILYASFDDVGFRTTIDGLTGFGRSNVTPLSLTTNDGFVTGATLTNITQRTEAVEDLFETEFMHFTLDAEWIVNDNLTAISKLGYSSAEEDELRRTYLYQHTGTFTYDISDPSYPKISGADFDYLNPDDYESGGFRYRPRSREDEEVSFQSDFDYVIDGDSALSNVEFGFRLSEKEVSQVRAEKRGRLSAFGQDDNTPMSEIGVLVSEIADGFLSGAPNGTPQDFWTVSPSAGAALLPTSLTADIPKDPQSTWTVQEDVFAYYLKTNWEMEWGIADIGVRIVDTSQTSIGSQVVGGAPEPVSIENNYTSVLPNINIRFDLNDELVVRFAANKAITRPTLGQLSPGITVSPTLLSASAGNPNLKPFEATQYDVSLEWYFQDEGLLSATLYYKDINSFIVNGVSSEVITGTNLVNDDGNNVSGSTFEVRRPINGDGGELSGIELSYQQPFGETGFGVLINGTISDSEGTFESQGQELRAQLVGHSDLTYNVIGYYENDEMSVRLAYSYRSDYRIEFREGFERRQDERVQLDISIGYDVTDQLKLSLDGLNVTGEDAQASFGPFNYNNGFQDQGAIYVVGARYKF
jgi:TonB-dependent receptor